MLAKHSKKKGREALGFLSFISRHALAVIAALTLCFVTILIFSIVEGLF